MINKSNSVRAAASLKGLEFHTVSNCVKKFKTYSSARISLNYNVNEDFSFNIKCHYVIIQLSALKYFIDYL